MAQTYGGRSLSVQSRLGRVSFLGVIVRVESQGFKTNLIGWIPLQHTRLSGSAERKTGINLCPVGDGAGEAGAIGEVDLNLGAVGRGAEDIWGLNRLAAETGTLYWIFVSHFARLQ